MIVVCLVGSTVSSSAQFDTGDAQLDATLAQVDANASANMESFKKEMTDKYKVDKSKMEEWMKGGMKPGDVYMTLETARASKKPVDDVAKSYQENKGQGWGAVARQMGIKPGSPEFKAMKANADKQASKGKSKQKSKKESKQKDSKEKSKS